MYPRLGRASTHPRATKQSRDIFRRVPLIALGFALVLGGCADEDPLGPVEELPPPPPATDTTSAAGVIAAHEYALKHKDLAMYSALLEQSDGKSAGFEYIPRDNDFDELPQLPSIVWNYDVEIDMIGNMMNPDFVSEETGNSVDTIEFSLMIMNERAVEGGGIELACSAFITVLWAENDGASSDIRFLFTLFPDGDGFLRIRTIAELPAFKRSVEESSWASVKWLYRSQ